MAERKLVFVYGTLLRTERNHHLLKQAKRVAEQAWTNGRLFATTADYPVLQAETQSLVYGELYEIDDALLEQLDELEAYQSGSKDNLYERIQQQIFTDQGAFTAFVYVMGKRISSMKRELIESGNWLVHQYLKSEQFYYFAYGSCMDDARFKVQHVNRHFQNMLGCGRLHGYTLRYTITRPDGGRADIVEEGGTVEGKVYDVGREAIDYLYKREGVYTNSYRPAVVLLRVNGGPPIKALTFIVTTKEPEVAPPAHYIEEILRGGKECCTESYITKLKDQYRNLS